MKEYMEPEITEEKIELEDIIAVSSGDSTESGVEANLWDLFNGGSRK